MLRGLDLESLTAPRLFHALVAIALDLNYRDEDQHKAEKRFFESLLKIAVEPTQDPEDPMELMAPPIPGLREKPVGIEG